MHQRLNERHFMNTHDMYSDPVIKQSETMLTEA